MSMKNLKSFDWKSLQGKLSSQSANDFNHFLEKLPINTSKPILIIIGVVWAAAAAMGLYATVQAQSLTKFRVELADAKATQPTIPQVKNVQINKKEIETFVTAMSKIYKGLTVKAGNASITIQGDSTKKFGQFREAIGHVQNGDLQWRVSVNEMCMGRECGKVPLMVSLKIARVDIRL